MVHDYIRGCEGVRVLLQNHNVNPDLVEGRIRIAKLQSAPTMWKICMKVLQNGSSQDV